MDFHPWSAGSEDQGLPRFVERKLSANFKVETQYAEKLSCSYRAPCLPSEALACQKDAKPTKMSSAVIKRLSVLQTEFLAAHLRQ